MRQRDHGGGGSGGGGGHWNNNTVLQLHPGTPQSHQLFKGPLHQPRGAERPKRGQEPKLGIQRKGLTLPWWSQESLSPMIEVWNHQDELTAQLWGRLCAQLLKGSTLYIPVFYVYRHIYMHICIFVSIDIRIFVLFCSHQATGFDKLLTVTTEGQIALLGWTVNK